MERDFLDKLLVQKEGPKLDFKREMYKIYDKSEASARAKDELIKDVLALANGNPSYASETGYLILGVSDQLDANGEREILGVTGRLPEEKDISQMVNAACAPPIDHLSCDTVDVDGKTVFVISVPPTPYVHETTTNLKRSPKGEHSKHVVFIRLGENTDIASYRDREALQRLKTIHFASRNNVPPVLFGAGSGLVIGGSVANVVADRLSAQWAEKLGATVGGSIVGAALGSSIGSSYVSVKQGLRDLQEIPQDKRPMAVIFVVLVTVFGTLISKRLLDTLVQYLQNKGSSPEKLHSE